MASQINASNSGFGGIVSTGDSSGVLELQAAGTTAVTIDTSQNVGIGNTAPNTRLHVQGGTNADGSLTYNQQLTSAAAYNASPATGTLVSLQYNSGGSYAGMGGWSVNKENATDGNFASYFALHTRPNGGSTTERMRIDSAGRVTMPYQPVFYAYDASGVNFTTSNAVISIGTATVNIGSCYNTSTYRFTAPVAGTYLFYFTMRSIGSGSGNQDIQFAFFKNGTKVSGDFLDPAAYGSNIYVAASLTQPISLAVGDYVEVKTGTVIGGINAGQRYFGGHLLG